MMGFTANLSLAGERMENQRADWQAPLANRSACSVCPYRVAAYATRESHWIGVAWLVCSALSVHFDSSAPVVSSGRRRHADCVGGRLDEVRDLVWVRDHGDVARGDFDGGRSHSRGELSFGVGRERLV